MPRTCGEGGREERVRERDFLEEIDVGDEYFRIERGEGRGARAREIKSARAPLFFFSNGLSLEVLDGSSSIAKI